MRIFINVRNHIRKILKEEFEHEPEVPGIGDFIYAVKDLYLKNEGGEITETEPSIEKGEHYQIIDVLVKRHGYSFMIKNSKNNEHWISYKTPFFREYFLYLGNKRDIDFNVDNVFNQLKEDKNSEHYSMIPRVGDILYCHTTLRMEDDGTIEATEGREYEVKGYDSRRPNSFWINDNSGDRHYFDAITGFDDDYTKWFTLIPPDIRNIDFFGQLKEENELEWAEDLVSKFIRPNQIFLIDKSQADISKNLYVKIEDIEFDLGNFGKSKVIYRAYNDHHTDEWNDLSEKVEFQWAANLIDTNYWIPVSNEKSTERILE